MGFHLDLLRLGYRSDNDTVSASILANRCQNRKTCASRQIGTLCILTGRHRLGITSHGVSDDPTKRNPVQHIDTGFLSSHST